MAKVKQCFVTVRLELGCVEVEVEVKATSKEKAFEAACKLLSDMSYNEICGAFDMSAQEPSIFSVGHDQEAEENVEMFDEEGTMVDE